MFEEQLKKFFDEVGSLHASNIARDLPQYIPLMKQYPEIAASGIHRFRSYLTTAPSDNLNGALSALYEIARQVPATRDQIIKNVGDVLYEYKALMPDHPESGHINNLLSILELPVSEQDAELRKVARSVVTLKQRMIVVVGAGFSYDAMPVTNELRSLLVPLLKDEGVRDPVKLLAEDDREVWRIMEQNEKRFKERFAGWTANAKPTYQHESVVRLLHDGVISHLVSFNWDDLCERAHVANYEKPISKVVNDGTVPGTPSLWKPHGDVERINEPWVFPYDNGRVFESLIESLDQSLKMDTPTIAVIVGYSEAEAVVRERLINWLERHVPTVLRVRPSWPETDKRGIRESARRFFQRLNIYMELERR